LRLVFLEPTGCELLVSRPAQARPTATLVCEGQPVPGTTVEAATDQIVEIAIPFADLKRTTNDPIQFFVELVETERSVDRAPREGIIETTTPSPNFEQIMWQV
jgi:hypothetical protein